MDDTIEGRLRPGRSARPTLGNLVTILAVLALAGAAWHEISTPTGAESAAEKTTPRSASPSSPLKIEPPSVPAILEATPIAPVVDVPTDSPATAQTTPPARPHHAPWWGLPVGAPPRIAYADRDLVHDGNRTIQLEPGSHVMLLVHAQSGPVVLVQDLAGTTRLEQLRTNGTRLELATFVDQGQMAQGVAVDPSGQRVAYGVTSFAGDALFQLVVRDLGTGDRLVSRTTRIPTAVQAWTSAGVVVTRATDPGGPPLLWSPDSGRLVRITQPSEDLPGPFLVASAPDREEWVVWLPESGCTMRVSSLGAPADKRFCGDDLYGQGAWSPEDDHVVARSGRHGVRVLDVRTGATRRLSVPRRGFVRALAWEDAHSVLVVLNGRGSSSAVLRCQVGGRCERARLSQAGTSMLTLSR